MRERERERSYTYNKKQFYENALRVPNPPFPKRIMLEVTNACNHRCIFCAHERMSRKVSFLDISFIMPILAEAYALGSREIAFHGGAEPLLYRDLAKLCAYAKEIGYEYIYLSTNGTACSEKGMQEILEAGLDSIKFSINGGDRESYARVHGKDDFERAHSMLRFTDDWRKKKQSSLRLYVSSVRVAQNEAAIEKILPLLSPHVDEIAITPVYLSNGGAREDVGPLEARFKNCAEPFGRLTISCEGYVRCCCNDYQNYLAVGSLHEESIGELWNSPAFVKLRECHLANKLENTLCHGCLSSCAMPANALMPRLATPYNKQEAAHL